MSVHRNCSFKHGNVRLAGLSGIKTCESCEQHVMQWLKYPGTNTILCQACFARIVQAAHASRNNLFSSAPAQLGGGMQASALVDTVSRMATDLLSGHLEIPQPDSSPKSTPSLGALSPKGSFQHMHRTSSNPPAAQLQTSAATVAPQAAHDDGVKASPFSPDCQPRPQQQSATPASSSLSSRTHPSQSPQHTSFAPQTIMNMSASPPGSTSSAVSLAGYAEPVDPGSSTTGAPQLAGKGHMSPSNSPPAPHVLDTTNLAATAAGAEDSPKPAVDTGNGAELDSAATV